MPAHQTPAQKAANRAFHNREEAKKGKRAKKPAEQQPQEIKPVRRTSKKPANRSALTRPAVWFLAAAILGGGLVQLLVLLFGRSA